jgi:hypothetical protein
VLRTRAGLCAHCAPQVRSEDSVAAAMTAPADVYAFGALMWQLYMRREPCSVVSADPDPYPDLSPRTLVESPGIPSSHWCGGGSCSHGGPRTVHRANPDLGAFPCAAPIMYALLAAACLSPEPGMRPTFAEVVEVFAALQDGALCGSCADLAGGDQVRACCGWRHVTVLAAPCNTQACAACLACSLQAPPPPPPPPLPPGLLSQHAAPDAYMSCCLILCRWHMQTFEQLEEGTPRSHCSHSSQSLPSHSLYRVAGLRWPVAACCPQHPGAAAAPAHCT